MTCSTMNKEQSDKAYMCLALSWSNNSYAIRRKVGAIIVKDKTIISDGFNGTPNGFLNVCEEVRNKSITIPEDYTDEEVRRLLKILSNNNVEIFTKSYVIHAEANAITKLARNGISGAGATIYVTDEPCEECAKLLIQSEIKRVVYHRPYRLHKGLELLRAAGVEVELLENLE